MLEAQGESLADLADRIAEAALLDRPYPDVAATLSETDAYAVQRSWVFGAYGEFPAGFKAGLTNQAAQARFGVTEPVIGALPEVARLDANAIVPARAGLLIEVEIGFLVGKDGMPAAMMGVVELPLLAFERPDVLDRNDVIGSNVSVYRFIPGQTTLLDPAVRDAAVVLERDGEALNRAFAADAMGDPLAAYHWMVGKARAVGYRVEPGMIMMTGALGRVVDATPGRYTATFEGMGAVEFEVR